MSSLESALNRINLYLAFKSLPNLVDGFCDLRVLVPGLDQPQGGLGGQVGGHHHVGLAPGHGSIGGSAKHPAVGHYSDEAVNVGAEVELDQVTVSQAGVWLRQQWRVVTDRVVDRDACWEGDT